MRIFKTKSFAKDAKTERLTDQALRKAIKEVLKGLIDAYLGGNLVKKRIAVGSKGKSGGLRTILVYKSSDENVFCIYVFAKNDTGNISSNELQALKLLGKTLLGMTKKEIEKAVKNAELEEVSLDGDRNGENQEDNENDEDE